jgi:hypothetical protein
VEGRRFDAVLNVGEKIPAEPVFVGSTYRFGVNTEPLEGVIWNGYKLIRGIRSGALYLYNLQQDPDEQNNIADENPDLIGEYTELLDDWNESFPSRIDELWDRPEQLDPNNEAVQALEALGYI